MSDPLIYKDYKNAASLSKSSTQQFLCPASLSQLCTQKKLWQGPFLSEDPVIALSRVCVTLCRCRSPAPFPTQTGMQSLLPLPPELVLLFSQANVIQLLQELKN